MRSDFSESIVMQRYLLVANQTLGGDDLVAVIRERMERGPAEFFVVVPATPSTHLIDALSSLSGAVPEGASLLSAMTDLNPRDQGIAVARSNLDAELARLRQLGATVHGTVGHPSPLLAIEKAVGERGYDEIILSTLPSRLSRWLALDLPRRIRRKIDIPLTVITASE
jgi:GABA permease